MVRMAVLCIVWLAKDWLIAAVKEGMDVMPRNFFLNTRLMEIKLRNRRQGPRGQPDFHIAG
jgi:hypothetical protein